MKTNIQLQGRILVFLAVTILLSSCAAKKELRKVRSENDQLKADVSRLNTQNQSLNQQVADLTGSYENYKKDCESAKNQLAEIETVIQQERETLKKVEEKLTAALMDFMDQGVMVENRNGLLYVSMEDELLYKSGSSKLGDKGKQALSRLAYALNDYPKLKVIVLGHADTVEFKGGGDNWSLSTDRANGVVRMLSNDFHVNPTRLTSAGRGKYDPVADNSTPQGRAKNRRTEIILRADVERIWKETKMEDLTEH